MVLRRKNTYSEATQSDNDNYSALIVTTKFDKEGNELKKLLKIGLGIFFHMIQVI